MSVLQMSLSGAVLILFIVVLRALTAHRLPKRTFSILWFVALCRLLIPVCLPSRFSLYTGLSHLSQEYWTGPVAKTASDVTEVVRILTPAQGGAASGFLAGSGTMGPAVAPLALVWLAGLCFCAAFFTGSYLRSRREFKTALPAENEIIDGWQRDHPLRRPVRFRQSNRIAAPLTYGVFRPVVLLPKAAVTADKASLEYILAHEYVHIRRFDALTKLLFTVAVCVHWFNPLVWVMHFLAGRDMELSCDASVVRLFGWQSRSAYARTLIGMEEGKSRWRPLYSGFSKNAIERRIVSVMKYKKATLVTVFAAALTIVCVTAVFATADSTIPKVTTVKMSDEAVAKMKAALPPAEPISEEALPEYWKMGALNVDGVPYLPLVSTAEALGYTVKTEAHNIDPKWNPKYPNAVEYNYELLKDSNSLGIASLQISDGAIVSYMVDQIYTKTHDQWDKPANPRAIMKDGIVYMPAQFFKEALDTGNTLP